MSRPDASASRTGVADAAPSPIPSADALLSSPLVPLPQVLVIFGASGDLANRKLLPAVASLAEHGSLPERFCIVGVARSELDDESFQKAALAAAPDAGQRWAEVAQRCRYVAGEYADPSTFERLGTVLGECEEALGTALGRVYYLATVPEVFSLVARGLAAKGLNRPKEEGAGFVRLVVEKPFGHDLDSARKLDADLHRCFDEEQIFRIDHYMGKETVQNVLALRFANAVFEPVWNRRYVDHVQITVAENLGVEHRGGFYEHAGALRDIVQNHVMQVLSLTMMEPPATVDAQGIRDEKVKLLRAIEIFSPDAAAGNVVRGQYTSGTLDGSEVVGYRMEDGVDPNSATETYVAMELRVDNWRWAGVPIYVRTGKRLAKRVTEVALQFQRVPHLAFGGRLSRELRPNTLVVRVQPDEGVTLLFGAKVPGEAFQVRSVAMDFSYATVFPEKPADAYERLLHDAMTGDATLFIRSDEVDQAWRIVDPFLDAFANDDVPLALYPAGSWGPHEANLLLERSQRHWREP
jgi:glucose-6-phosphate 1-dehydrogenase